MTIAISFDPTNAEDVAYVQNILGVPEEAPAPAAAPKKAAAKAAAKPAPVEEPDEDEATVGDGPTLQECIDAATALVSEGRAADVKGVLAQLGVKRVGELEESQYAEFLEKVNEESPV